MKNPVFLSRISALLLSSILSLPGSASALRPAEVDQQATGLEELKQALAPPVSSSAGMEESRQRYKVAEPPVAMFKSGQGVRVYIQANPDDVFLLRVVVKGAFRKIYLLRVGSHRVQVFNPERLLDPADFQIHFQRNDVPDRIGLNPAVWRDPKVFNGRVIDVGKLRIRRVESELKFSLRGKIAEYGIYHLHPDEGWLTLRNAEEEVRRHMEEAVRSGESGVNLILVIQPTAQIPPVTSRVNEVVERSSRVSAGMLEKYWGTNSLTQIHYSVILQTITDLLRRIGQVAETGFQITGRTIEAKVEYDSQSRELTITLRPSAPAAGLEERLNRVEKAWNGIAVTPSYDGVTKRMLPVFYTEVTLSALPIAARAGPVLIFAASRPGLEKVRGLMERLAIPPDRYRIWRVEGEGQLQAAFTRAEQQFSGQFHVYPVNPQRPDWLKDLLTGLEEQGNLPIGDLGPAVEATEEYFRFV